MMMLMDEFREAREPSLFGDEEASDSMLSRFKSLLKNADIGIIDMRVNRKEQVQGRDSDLRVLN